MKGAGLKRDGTDLVPVAVVLCGMAVILQDFGDGALVNALQTELPLSQLEETSAQAETEETRRWTHSWLFLSEGVKHSCLAKLSIKKSRVISNKSCRFGGKKH